MQHTKIVIMEGPEEWITTTLSRSLQFGKNKIGPECTITIIPIPSLSDEEIDKFKNNIYEENADDTIS